MDIDPWDAQDHARWRKAFGRKVVGRKAVGRKAVGRRVNPAEPGNTTVNSLMVRMPESTQLILWPECLTTWDL